MNPRRSSIPGHVGNRPQAQRLNPRYAASGPRRLPQTRALATLDQSGWPPHPSERRDFYHCRKAFSPEVPAWHKRRLRHLLDHPARFPLAASVVPEKIQARLDDGISYLREVARILAVLSGTPDLGNKQDPTDELVYILLARHTREDTGSSVFKCKARKKKGRC